MSELKGAKMEGSKVPAEEIKNPDLVAAIEKMQDDNTTENINKMIGNSTWSITQAVESNTLERVFVWQT